MMTQGEMNAAPLASRFWNRELTVYPDQTARRLYLLLVVLITVVLYYELYVGGGVATLMMADLNIPFEVFVYVTAISNLLGAFASLVAGLADRFGRANLVIYGQLLAALITLFWMPNVTSMVSWGIALSAVAFVEGIVLVATPALVRDFSPQVGRAAAMGFWTIGPVLGSLAVSGVVTLTLPHYRTWQSQYIIAGALGLVLFVLSLLFLRELTPSLRDQLMVSERDRMLVELKAKGLNVAASLAHPWRQVLRVDIIASALGVSMLLFFYYTMVGFGVIYLVTIFQYSVDEANALFNWTWATEGAALVAAGLLSDRLRVRKPFMLVGAIGFCALVWLWLQMLQAAEKPSIGTLTVISSCLISFSAMAYVTWMASFTETIEAHNPALTAIGLALWGWIIRVAVSACFVLLPSVVTSMNPLLGAGPVLAAYEKAVADKVPPSAELLAALGQVKQAAVAAPAEWRTWYWICIGAGLFFTATISVMRGRWSPVAAKRDQEAHDAVVARELAKLRESSGLAQQDAA
ncbi:MFS transporter [Ralstonia soli]|uniref:MFS transporter n=1 Tax=Ralstonia soli TaxID=2953896 RepID=A0ABT1AGJ4_9RALS|nr:MFS transporter [Ralstonia soli]MCO5397520.1 MFS transporter [Ralstonia soli]